MRQQQLGTLGRDELLARALRLVTASVMLGALSGTLSVITGPRDGSLGVFAVGLGALADVTGSTALVWRFRAEQRHPGSAHPGSRLTDNFTEPHSLALPPRHGNHTHRGRECLQRIIRPQIGRLDDALFGW
jgi:hypothetical protein